MIGLNFIKLRISAIVLTLIFLGTGSLFWGVNGIVKDIEVSQVVIITKDVKAGLEPIHTKTLSTSDSDEINVILNTLEKPIFYKTFPNFGGVPTNNSDHIELIIALHSGNDQLLEYVTTSQGNITIKMFNRKALSKNVNILASRNTKWFEQLRELYEDKEKSKKWKELQ